MISDANKGIAAGGIEYNHLNMPTKITVSNGGSNNGVIDYVYTADGIKLQKKKTQGGVTTTTDYIGNYVYENGALKQFNQPEGYVEPDGNGWQYVYRYTDIWGNTRLTYADDNGNGSIDPSTEIRREQNYYPFGMEHKGYNTVLNGVKNNLKTYQKQEFTEDLGLNTHEWKYRISDPATGRFWQIDPLAEKYTYNSTYAFQENKLGSGIELEGLENLEFEDQMFLEMSREAQAVAAEVGSVVDKFFVSVKNTYKKIVSKIGGETVSNTTTVEISETTTSRTNLEEYISNINPGEDGVSIMPDTPVTKTETKMSVNLKNTSTVKIPIRGPVSVTEKLSVSENFQTQDVTVSGSADLGVSQNGNSASTYISGSTSSNSGNIKVQAGVRATVKNDNTSSTFTFGFEHEIKD